MAPACQYVIFVQAEEVGWGGGHVNHVCYLHAQLYTHKNLTACQQDVFALLVASCIVDKSGTSSYTLPGVDAHSE
jgi:hypothetical protein